MITRGAAALAAAWMLAGCGASSEQAATKSDSGSERIREFENRFVPSDEDRPGSTPGAPASASDAIPPAAAAPAAIPSGPTEEVPGFRIQLYSTNDFDDAGAKKEEAEALFTGEWIYMQYDQPTYKIRAGNFLTRFDAERFRALAIEKGFTRAWIVPERVFKNPSPPVRPAPKSPE